MCRNNIWPHKTIKTTIAHQVSESLDVCADVCAEALRFTTPTNSRLEKSLKADTTSQKPKTFIFLFLYRNKYGEIRLRINFSNPHRYLRGTIRKEFGYGIPPPSLINKTFRSWSLCMYVSRIMILVEPDTTLIYGELMSAL